MNVNLCWLDHSFLDDTLRQELKKIASLSVKYPSYYGIDYGMGDDSIIHLIPQHEKKYDLDVVIPSFEYCLLSLFRYWNVIYYYFPHKYLMDTSWDQVLNESIFPFIRINDKQSYEIAFLKLAATLNDGHAYTTRQSYLPVELNAIEKVEGKTIVKIDKGGLNKGDIIHSIGKREIDSIRDSLSALISASTPGNKEYRINCYITEMIFFNETDVTILRNGQKLKVHITPFPFEYEKPYLYKRITKDIGYVDLPLLTTEEIAPMFQSLSDARGIIFDLRKHPRQPLYDMNQFFCYLSDQKVISIFPMALGHPEHPGAYLWKIPQIIIPDSLKCTRFKGKILFLIDESTQSALETIAWEARVNFHATLIGRPTSGALGRIIKVPLPGFWTSFSGFALFSLDGSELQRKGILPDIEVYPTMESIKAGKDEILEAAIKYLNN